MTSQLAPLVERGQASGVFRRDLPVTWHMATVRAIVHMASAELLAGRIAESEVEAAMLTTALSAIAERAPSEPRKRLNREDSR